MKDRQNPIASPPLSFTNVSKLYGSFRAVNSICLTVEAGEIFGLLGPNGAGKTTCINMVTTLTKPTEGEIRVFGKRIQEEPEICKTLFGAVPQEMITHGFFNVQEILRFHSGYYGIQHNEAWLRYILKKLKLWVHRHKLVRQLSGGMKKRLLIAKALVHRPPLILLDEPTAGVDIELRDTLWSFIEELKEKGTTVLLTTHYLQEAESLCDRVGIIDHGEIKQLGQTQELINRLTQRRTTLLLQEPPTQLKSPYLSAREGRTLTFTAPASVTLQELLHSSNISATLIEDVHIQEGTLEDAVRHILTPKEIKEL